MVWARTDLVAVLVVVCGGWHLWGEFSEWEVFCIVGRIWRPAYLIPVLNTQLLLAKVQHPQTKGACVAQGKRREAR